MTCQYCNSPESIDGKGTFNCGSYRNRYCGFRSAECQLGEKILKLTKERDTLKEWIEDLSFWERNPSTEKMGTVEVLLDPQEFVYVGNRKPEGLK